LKGATSKNRGGKGKERERKTRKEGERRGTGEGRMHPSTEGIELSVTSNE